VHVFGAPAVQVPLTQTSPTVQALPSLQEPPSGWLVHGQTPPTASSVSHFWQGMGPGQVAPEVTELAPALFPVSVSPFANVPWIQPVTPQPVFALEVEPQTATRLKTW